MTALHRDLSAPEVWQRSLERSRRRRVTAPKLRRQAARRKHASSAMAAAMLAGPAAQLAAAQPSSDGSSQPNIASESPANRAIGGGEDRAAQMGLALGSAGQAVVAVQRKLDVKATGYFDADTDRRVRVFQGNNGLKVDGIVGPRTWRALFASGSTVPTAGIGGPDLKLEPAVATGDDARVGNRTQFAVRMASDDELDSGERGELNAHRAATRSRDGGALVAIEFRAPEGKDTGESSASDNGRSASAARSGSNAGDRSQSDDGGSRGSSRGESGNGSQSGGESRGNDGAGNDNGNSAGNGDSEPKPGNEGRPRNDAGGSSGSGSCSREIEDPLDGRGTHTSGYGPRWGRMHTGVDLAAPSGTPIRAAACGVISFLQGSSQSGGYGNFICIKHSSSFTTCYAHLSRFSNKGVGDYVKAGRIIGYVGSTGHSTGPHLHFETRTGNPYGANTMDPSPYLHGREFSGTQVSPSTAGIGGPDLAQPQQKDSTASAPAATSAPESSTDPEPSAVKIATADAPPPE